MQSISAAALVGFAVWLYQAWSTTDTDRRQRMQRLAQSAEVLQAITEQIRQPCVATREECEKRFIDESTKFSVNEYNFTEEARYFIDKRHPLRAAVNFVDDFYNPGKQESGRLGDFRYTPLQIAITRAREVLTSPFRSTEWCTAERREAMRVLTISADILRYCGMVIRTFAWEEATGGTFHTAHNTSDNDYKLCTMPQPESKSRISTTVWRSNQIGTLLANMDNLDHSAPWLFDSYCAASGLAIGGGIIPPRTRQLVAVKTSSWEAREGRLVRYVRNDETAPWRRDGEPTDVFLGQAGLGWGSGLMPIPAREDSRDPFKEEGDGRSPAGLFPLGTIFAEKPVRETHHLSVRITTDELYCDDRPKSSTYNQVIRWSETDRRNCQQSDMGCPSEPLKRTDGIYKQFIWVNYNENPIVKAAGSCIFLHLHHSDRAPTTGCTTVSPSEMRNLIAWLDPLKYPLLLQLPEDEFTAAATAMKLPQ